MGVGGTGGGGGPRSGSGSSRVGGSTQGGGGGGDSRPRANVTITFSLKPNGAVSYGIDYTITNWIKLYYKVMTHLETYYYMDAQSLKSFLAQEEDRIREANRENVINIDDYSGGSFNLVTHYGQLSIKEGKNNVITNWVDKPNFRSQNSMHMYVFHRGYLTPDALSEVII